MSIADHLVVYQFYLQDLMLFQQLLFFQKYAWHDDVGVMNSRSFTKWRRMEEALDGERGLVHGQVVQGGLPMHSQHVRLCQGGHSKLCDGHFEIFF